MKSYSFSKISARGYLTEADYNNKYIFTEDLKQVINVSEKQLLKDIVFFRDRDIIARNMPLKEVDGDMGYKTILKAVRYLLFWDRSDKRSIVCCDFGVNRSRTVVEAFHYAKMGFHFEDEYKGYFNHLIYNCEAGHLPPLAEVECELKRLGDQYNPDVQKQISEMKKSASGVAYNRLAEKIKQFMDDAKAMHTNNCPYKDLSPIMSSFTDVRIKEGYILDGFQSGLPHFGSSLYLHARKEDGSEFVPFDWEEYHSQSPILTITEVDKRKEEELEKAVELYFKTFDDSMYIRKPLCDWHAEKFVRPIFKDLIVPFNENGILEAVLLYLAPRFMDGYWHSIYADIDIVTSDSDFIRKCKTVDDYNRFTNADILKPSVEIQSETTATVSFAAWGYYGLNHWKLKVIKDGESVSVIKDDDSIKDLLYYEPRFIV